MRDGRTTNDEQGKIELLSQMDAGWLSFAIWQFSGKDYGAPKNSDLVKVAFDVPLCM